MVSDIFLGLRSDDNIAILGLAVLGALVLVIWLISKYVSATLKTRQMERTKREVAAYVAEGTIGPDDAVRILSAGLPDLERRTSHPRSP